MSELFAATAPLHADAALVAFDKPAGLLTVPGRDANAPSLWRLAEAAGGQRLWAVHRLDRETSGLVLFARTAESHRALSQAFEARHVAKRYLARVSPPPVPAEGTLRGGLVAARRGFMRLARPGEAGQSAETDYQTLEVRGDEALLDLRPRTGRTHQLRIQLAELGSPIVGEPHYRPMGGPGLHAKAGARLWLHAAGLVIDHPVNGQRLELSAPSPPGLWP